MTKILFPNPIFISLAGGWRVIEGHTEGQSQVDVASIFEESYLAHPIDVHLITKTLQGWWLEILVF